MNINITKTLVFAGVLFLFSACSENVPEYIQEINSIDDYEYTLVDTFQSTEIDTLNVQMVPVKEAYDFIELGDVLEMNDSTIWISDKFRGQIISFTEYNGIKVIAERGKGPGEFISPTLLSKGSYVSNTIYVMDTNNKALAQLNADGSEEKRYYISSIPNSIIANKLFVKRDGSFVWPTRLDTHHVLNNWDSLGNKKDGLANRLIDFQKQPEGHNSILYAIDENKELFAYSYVGLPLIFIETSGHKKVVNILPEVELSEINPGLKELPYNTRIHVERIIRSVDIIGENILVGLKDQFIVIRLKTDQRDKKIILKTENGSTLIYHTAKVSGKHLYLMNMYENEIYKLSLDRI